MWRTCGRGPQLLNQAITQPSRLERTSRALWTHLPLRGIYSGQVVQGYVQFNLEHLQGHWSHTLSGQLLPVFDQTHGWSNKILYIENFQIFVCFRQWLLPLFLLLRTSRKSLTLSSLLFVRSAWNLLFLRMNGSNYPSLSSNVPACKQLGSHSQNFLCILKSPKLCTVFHKCQIEEKDHFSHLWLGKTIANAAQDSLALHYCNGTLLAHVWLTHHDPPDHFM